MKIPGLIDLQVNGYKGVDFSGFDLTEEKFIYACRELFKAGTAAFLPTLITLSEGIYKRNLPLIASVIDRDEFKGKLLGLHLEGPFISPRPGAAGVHNPDEVCRPPIEYLEKLQGLANGTIKLLTIAAEIKGADMLTKYAVKNGITISLGHQMAGFEDIKKFYDTGAKSMTHLGNGMPNQVPRHHNPITAALVIKNLEVMIITDGHHLPEQVIRTVINAIQNWKIVTFRQRGKIVTCQVRTRVVLWYLKQKPANRYFMVHPWYCRKETPSFADAIACLRRQLWRGRINRMFGILPYMIKNSSSCWRR